MGLTQAQRSLIEKARSVGNSDFAVPLSDGACCYLIAVIVNDLALTKAFPELPRKPLPFFGTDSPDTLELVGLDFWSLAERLMKASADADTYFSCLAMLHKCRLKYARILQRQPLPTMDQVGPRGLLQYGVMSQRALTGFMLWELYT